MPENHNSVVNDFRQARRRAQVEQILARLTGRSSDLLCYEQVRDLLKVKASRHVGRQEIPLESIVGSVERCSDYTRSLLPLRDTDQKRWTGVREAVTDSKELPPIKVYRIGDACFLIDGHHRASVARQRGWTHIEAEVVEIHTRVTLTPEVQPDELLVKAELADFLEHTHLDENRPQADLQVRAPGQYQVLEAQIEAHRRTLAGDQKREIPYEEAAGRWYDAVYLPTLQLIREREMLQGFPTRTETDLFLWLCEHRMALSEGLGWEVGLEQAAADLVRQFRLNRRQGITRTGERLLDAVAPDRLQAGPSPGSWRVEREGARQDDCLFANILVPVSGEVVDWPAVAQAAEIACRESARLIGVHVVSSMADTEGKRAKHVRAEFARHCEAVDVAGTLTVEVGRMSRQICRRSQWADLIVMGLARPPASRLADRLTSELCTLIRRCATPLLAVPGAFSPLEHSLLAYNGSPKAREALYVATYLALRARSSLVVLSVEEGHLDPTAALAEAQAYLERHGVQASYVQEQGPVAEALLRTAEAHGADLILMGGYEHPPVVEVFLGSAVDEVLRTSRQPVLLCR
jgi:nucleotide-binding universal stress UspA family protein